MEYIVAVPGELVWFATLSVIGRAEGVKLPDPSEMITLIVGEVTDSAPAIADTDASELKAN